MLILFQSRAHRERELSHTLTDTHRLNCGCQVNADGMELFLFGICWILHGTGACAIEIMVHHLLIQRFYWFFIALVGGFEVFFFVLLVFGAVAGKEQIGASVVNVWESNRNSSVFTIASVEQITCFAITWFNCTHTHTNTFKHILVMRLMANTSHFGDDYSMACRTYVVVS